MAQDGVGPTGRWPQGPARALIIVLAVLAVVIIGVSILAGIDLRPEPGSTYGASAPPAPSESASDGQASATASLAPADTTTAATATDAPSTPQVKDVVEAGISAQSELLRAPSTDGPTTDIPSPVGLLDGPYAESVAATAVEYAAMGYRQIGTPTVAAVEVLEVDLEATPPTATVLACIDNSTTDVVDRKGNSVRNEGTPSRSRYLYTLHYVDGQWGIVNMTFPDDPTC